MMMVHVFAPGQPVKKLYRSPPTLRSSKSSHLPSTSSEIELVEVWIAPPHAVVRHPAGAEDVTVREPLRRDVADRQLAQHALGARVGNLLELVVQDVPLGVDDGLVVG